MRRAILQGYQLETTKTLASDFTTSPIDVKTMDNIGINIDCNNVTDNTGTFDVQWRVYKDANVQSEWATLTLSTTPTLANADTTFFLNLNQLPVGQVRVKFTAAGGTPDGDCDIWVSGNSVGA